MKQNLFFTLFFVISIYGFSQKQQSMWSAVNSQNIEKSEKVERLATPNKHKIFTLNVDAFKSAVANAPKRELQTESAVIVEFPDAEGNLELFRVQEASNMAPELQAQFPQIRAYIGKSLTNPSSVLRFSLSPEKGLSSMLLNEGKTVFIEPYTKDLSNYIVYVNSKEDEGNRSFICETEDITGDFPLPEGTELQRNANDGKLRTFRLALACTGEYTSFHGGTVNGALAAMNATMTRVNGVFERDVAIRMELVANNTSIIYLNSGTDPFTNNNGGAMLSQNQTTCDSVIGNANYDIGHVFSTGGGGIAQLNSPCVAGNKARGVTGSNSPTGDSFDIDYVAHEMGHQYGATHTQNNDCQRTQSTAVEPGSASTIMGYAGICNPNVQFNSDDYFHGVSILQMWNNISSGSSQCAAQSSSNNIAPVANAGSNYNIPKSTAFVLKGSATDADAGNTLTYCWEQVDTESAIMPPVSTSTVGPAYRSLDPTTSPDRYMPAYNTVRNGLLQTTWEVTPSVGRTMNFLLTVRDNAPVAGSTSSDLMTVTVEDVPAFTVNTPPAWGANSNQTVTWNVGSTNNATINCQNVNIKFSTDGGVTFPTVLAANTPNDGSQQITVPNVPDTTSARILIEAADNIFYALSSNFSISNNPDFGLSCSNANQNGGCGTDSVTYNLDFTAVNGFSETTTFSASGNPSGTAVVFSPTNLNTTGSFTMEVSGVNSASNGNYTITVTANSTSVTKTLDVTLNVSNGLCTSIANTDYNTSTTLVQFNTINNSSGKPSGYSDYTNISTDVNRESAYNLTVNMNTDGNYLCYTTVWIDWNQNCVFDANEMYDLGQAVNTANGPSSNSPLSIVVPADAVLGQTTMRVATKYGEAATACENNHDAEVEDYTINVLASLSVEEEEVSSFKVYPNPNNGEFTLQLNTYSNTDVTVDIFDLRGRKIFNTSFRNSTERKKINLKNAQSGMYMMVLTEGNKKATKKIIIE